LNFAGRNTRVGPLSRPTLFAARSCRSAVMPGAEIIDHDNPACYGMTGKS